MYIEFSNDFANNIQKINIKLILDILTRAKIAANEGYHIVSCESQQVAEKIKNYIIQQTRNNLVASFCSEMQEDIPEINGLRNKVSLYASITSRKNTSLAFSSRKIVEIGLDVARLMDFWKGLYFLVENSHDAIMYKLIALFEKEKDSSLKKIEIYFNIVNGGGGNTHKEMERINNGKCFILCFLDSDKKDPSQRKYGSTASKFKKKDITALSSFCVINAHELENLFFTYEFTQGMCLKNKDLKDVNDKVCIAETISSDFRLYFDVKNGYKKKEALNIPYLKKSLNVQSYCNKKSCPCCCCDNCEELEIGGFGTHFLEDIGNQCYNRSGSARSSFYADAKGLNGLQKQEWERLGKSLLSWGCSYKSKSYGI